VLQLLIVERPFGTWVTAGEGELVVNHLPFLLDRGRGDNGTLMGHVARSNPVWRQFSTALPSVFVFQGHQAYISPSWYPSKAEHGKAVPTWNYVVVHAHGLPRAIHDRDWLLDHVTRHSATREAGRASPWQVSDAPAAVVETLLKGIVGIEVPIGKLEGKWKVNQNLPAADRLGAAAGLCEQGDAAAVEMADLIRSRAPA
jgi:transcriptional regulator